MGLFDDISKGVKDLTNRMGPVGNLLAPSIGMTDKFNDLVNSATGKSGQDLTDKALSAQERAAREANATQKYIYDQTRQDQAPWREAGTRALTGLEDPSLMQAFTADNFQQDPGYQFRLAEGQKALERSAAARGNLMSGGTLKALTGYNQGMASQEYANAYDRFNNDRTTRFNMLSSLAGVGQVANNQMAQAGQNYGNNVSANQMGVGNAQAAAYIGQANNQAATTNQLIGGGAMLLASDERVKTEIEPISKEEISELRQAIKPYAFKYLNDEFGKGDWVGVMAQDLEKTRLGKKIVEEVKGVKMLSHKKIMSLFLATLAEV